MSVGHILLASLLLLLLERAQVRDGAVFFLTFAPNLGGGFAAAGGGLPPSPDTPPNARHAVAVSYRPRNETQSSADFFLSGDASEQRNTSETFKSPTHTVSDARSGTSASAALFFCLWPAARLCRLRTPTRCPKRHAAPHAPSERQENGGVCADKLSRIPRTF